MLIFNGLLQCLFQCLFQHFIRQGVYRNGHTLRIVNILYALLFHQLLINVYWNVAEIGQKHGITDAYQDWFKRFYIIQHSPVLPLYQVVDENLKVQRSLRTDDLPQHFWQHPVRDWDLLYTEIARKDFLNEIQQANGQQDVTILVGPEGDFSIDEVNQALEKGFSSVSLGQNRLRTETAGLVSIVMSQVVKRVL